MTKFQAPLACVKTTDRFNFFHAYLKVQGSVLAWCKRYKAQSKFQTQYVANGLTPICVPPLHHWSKTTWSKISYAWFFLLFKGSITVMVTW